MHRGNDGVPGGMHAFSDNGRTSMCFACGEENPIGLKLDFRFEGESLVSTFRPAEIHSGYPGVVHGGIVCTLLDEAMAKLLWYKGYEAYTASLNVRFRHKTVVGKLVRCTGRVTDRRGRVFVCYADLRDEEGRLLAEATGKYVAAAQGDKR